MTDVVVRRERKLSKGQKLYAQGDDAYYAYRMKKGIIKLVATDDEGIIRGIYLVEERDFFGEESLCAIERRYTAAALVDAEVEELEECDRGLLFEAAYHRMRWYEECVAEQPAAIQVAEALIRFSYLPLYMYELGALARVSRETASRIVSWLIKSGVLEHHETKDGRIFIVEDPDALREVALIIPSNRWCGSKISPSKKKALLTLFNKAPAHTLATAPFNGKATHP